MTGVALQKHHQIFTSTGLFFQHYCPSQHFVLQSHLPGICPALVDCVISHRHNRTFFVSFFVQNLPLPRLQQGQWADFLWQGNCFECFFSQGAYAYAEINASPEGDFACYDFESYRTPDALPPIRATQVQFAWQKNFYEKNSGDWHFCITLPKAAKLINPTAVLLYHNTPFYYAAHHKSVPDFHDTAYWHALKK